MDTRRNKEREIKRKEKNLQRWLKDYDRGFLNEAEEIGLFQELIDNGTIGEYGEKFSRLATTLIEKGLCTGV